MIKYFVVLAFVSSCVLLGCSSNANQQEKEVPAKFMLSKNMLDSIKTDTVKLLQVKGVLNLTGTVSADGSKVLKIFPTLSGYAANVEVQLGDYVHKGQLLAVVHSGEMASYEKQLADAQSSFVLARKKLEVQADLLKSQLSTQKDVVDAENDVHKAESEIKELKDLFRIYRKGAGATYQIIAPISGYVIEKAVNNGMEIQGGNSESLFTISEIDDVWVMASVFESDIPKVSEGDSTDVTAISYPSRIFKGQVDKIYNFLDPATKTMQLRIRINNQAKLLKPEMFTSVKIYYPGHKRRVAVPASAIIFDNDSYYVLVMSSHSDIKIKEVLPAQTAGGITYLDKGVDEGDIVITKNQLLIYNALLQG